MNTLSISVLGKFQGVWFKKHTKEKAISLDLKGYVMNKKDGTVFIEIIKNIQKQQHFYLG